MASFENTASNDASSNGSLSFASICSKQARAPGIDLAELRASSMALALASIPVTWRVSQPTQIQCASARAAAHLKNMALLRQLQ